MFSRNNKTEEEVILAEPRIEEEKSKVYLWIIFLIAAVFLFLIVIGFSYSIFSNRLSGNKGPLCSGVIFNYSDGNGSKNSISIKNARDINDEVGKVQSGEGSYFDFNVSGNTKNLMKRYIILLEKDEMLSTIPDSDIKIYLTKYYGSMEKILFVNVPTYDELEDMVIDGKKYKVLYINSFDDESEYKFSDDYRLRVWIKENASDYYGKSYSVKVHIYTEGAGELCE